MSETGSRLAGGLEERAFERLGGVLAGPDDELERLEVAVAGLDRGDQQAARPGCELGSAPPDSSRAWRNMMTPSAAHRSKWPIHICSLTMVRSRMTSITRASGTLRSKAQARWIASLSSIHEKET